MPVRTHMEFVCYNEMSGYWKKLKKQSNNEYKSYQIGE